MGTNRNIPLPPFLCGLLAFCGTAEPNGIVLFGFRISDFGFRILTGASEPDRLPPLRPARAPLPPTFWEQYGTWVLLGGVLILLLTGLLVWLLFRPRPATAIPPEILARRTLESLRQEPETGALLSRVSQTVKTYFGVVFGLPEGELTTAEFSRALTAVAEPGIGLKSQVCEFLRTCDERKFAPSTAPEAKADGARAPLGAVTQAGKLIDAAEKRRAELRAGAEAKRAEANASSRVKAEEAQRS